ncbi:Uu.00g080400.m01.CDS01 [Anthostomella pinea]|uniref:Uu.00g080400.m01.CDS01 n=1 Tax=Anthostomella pinea TaxID=933095 RepID=A0AAI8YGX3_9PEZI|nr:Uu.00g080400.m01.CDS01 [Anthostomella pinea]
MALEEATVNGVASFEDVTDPSSVDYAGNDISFDEKAFVRARLGGAGSMLREASVGIQTSGTKTMLDGGIFQVYVGLHMVSGDNNGHPGSVSQLPPSCARS